jgi:trimethylamine--corrinoid protein Co-methyltransferase
VAGSGVGLSLEHAIIQDEALGYLGRMVRSFDVNDDTLAVDLIEQVGIGGNFFAEEHTVRHMRSELWQDRGIFKACDYETWARNGAKTVLDRAHARLEDILATALPLEPILEPGKTHELKRIEDRYSKDFNATSASY